VARPLLVAAGVALLGITGVAGLLIASSGGEEEAAVQTQPSASGSQTATPKALPSPTLSPTASPLLTPSPSGAAPAWRSYSDPDGRFTLSFPAGWFLEDGATSKVRPPGQLTSTFSSFQPGTVSEFPASALKVDLYAYSPVPGNDCRIIPDGATAGTLGGASGFQKTTTAPSEGSGRNTVIAAYRSGYCYSLTAYFGRDNNDDSTFTQLVESFRFAQ